MTRSKLAVSLLSATALAVSLAACGDDDGGDGGGEAGGGDYCGVLEEIGNSYMESPDMSDPDAMSGIGDDLQKVADAAPDDIKEDWQKLADAMGTLADIDPEDPDSMEKLQEFEDLEGVNTRITEHVESECPDVATQ